MRAQITGLEGATKNAKDGISLIQTAEGALTEVHSMLNRMVTLTEQSANGTYDNEVDRAQLQKEVDALKTEIDRVADSTNFNGLKLLDGSLSGGGNLKGVASVEDTKAVKGAYQTAAFSDVTGLDHTKGDSISYTLSWKDGQGNDQTTSIKFTIADDNKSLVAADGTKYTMNESKTAKDADIAKAIKGELAKTNVNDEFNISLEGSDKKLKFESKVEGSKGAVITGTDTQVLKDGQASKAGAKEFSVATKAMDVMQKLDLSKVKVLNKTNVKDTGDAKKAIDDNTFEVDGKKFILTSTAADYDYFRDKVDSDVTIINLNQTDAAKLTAATANYANNDANDAKEIANELSRVTGRSFKVGSELGGSADDRTAANIADTDIVLTDNGAKLSKSGKGLELQIGDTSDKFNKMSVEVADMHVKALGLTDVDISTQEGASVALSQIKDAVNKVSDTRGGLGALQNRLDHTINNLGVMRENIQNAESSIRDTDVAEEMMTYTKNSILNQSAQAMLAQANQLPQGVLQLLG